MARLIESHMTPTTSIVIQTLLEDGSVKEKELKIGDDVKELRYLDGVEVKTVTGKLSKINYNNLQVARTYGSVATVRSFFASDVVPVSIEVDCSEQYAANIVTIPVNEIIEDKDVKDVVRMKSYLKYGVHFEYRLTEDEETVHEYDFHEGDDLHNLVFMDRSGDVTVDARVVAFTYDANLVPLTMVIIENGRVRELDVVVIKEVGAVVPVTVPGGDVTEHAVDGLLNLAAGEFTEDINVTESMTIRGAYAGINGLARVEDPDDYTAETVISGKITVSAGANLVLDGVTLTGNALVKVPGAEVVTLNNSVVKDLVPDATKSFLVNLPASDKATKLTMKGNYFGANPDAESNKFWNGFELTNKLADGSVVSGNYFTKGVAANNLLCLYAAEDGATITVRDNTFEESINAVRVGFQGDVEAHVELVHNTYLETLTGEDAKYAGLLLVQPYGTLTTSMAKVVIRLAGTVNESTESQLFYIFCDKSDTQLTADKVPTIIVDGIIEVAPTPAE